MRLHVRFFVLVGVLQLLSAGTSYATFHIIDVNEVYSNADGTIQFVELIADFNFQTELSGARIIARGPNGTPLTVVLDITTNFPALGNGETVLFATAGFEAVAGFSPDYLIPNNSLIPFPSGQVTFENDLGTLIVDRVAYGAYTGTLPVNTTPSAALPCNGRQSLTRVNATSDNPSVAFALRVPSPMRNDGTTVQLQLPVGTDCNENTVPDLCDIATGVSPDANGNHVPDECDPPPGCQGDPGACEDGDVCNGLGTCNVESGQCEPGTPLDCNDNDACTVDDCDPVTGCFTEARNCDDGDPCNVEECFPQVGCQSEPVCSLGFSCEGGECFCSEPRGDFDGDGHLDGVDTVHELGCVDGPGGEVLLDCACADLDDDGDVDLADLADYFNRLTAP